MKHLIKIGDLAAIVVFGVSPAIAADAASPQATTLSEAISEGKSLTNFRLRYEYVDQDGKTENANAWTLRSLIGWQTKPFHDVSVAAQVIGVSPLNNEYNDSNKGVSEPGKGNYPVVLDPENYGINQLLIEWSGIPKTKVRLGRQSVKLDNVRFVGNVEFRQVMQVYDGVAVENKSLPNTDIYLAHFGRVKQINTLLRDGNFELANIKYKFTPTESLAGYAYFVDWDSAQLAATSPATSNKTFGLRLNGDRKLNEKWKVLYTAEYAKQDNYKDGNSNIDNYYYLVGAGAGYGNWYARLDQELLSGNSKGKAFQTQLGTNHLFQGWTDLFLTTPNEGIQDTFITAGGKLMKIDLKAEYHWINSDRDFAKVGGGTSNQYGKEFDVSAAYSYNKQLSGKVEYANFKEVAQYNGARKRDTEKLWLSVMYAF
ncbi:MAG: alginate export family protein [Methylophilaceae bacterium]